MILWALFRALALTCLIEGAAMGLLFRRWREVYYSLLCNLLTNPALNLLLFLLAGNLGLPYIPVVAVLEVLAVGVEAVVYALLCPNLTKPKAAGLSLLLNGLSFGLGLLIT